MRVQSTDQSNKTYESIIGFGSVEAKDSSAPLMAEMFAPMHHQIETKREQTARQLEVQHEQMEMLKQSSESLPTLQPAVQTAE